MRLSTLESKIFGKVCYGYQRDKRGIVETVPGEEEIVKKVFTLYLDGNSLGAIQQYLFENNIPSPSGKDKWSRDVLNKLLNNFKYTFGIIDCDIYRAVKKLKERNCRNPNCVLEDEDEWDEQPNLNYYGLML